MIQDYWLIEAISSFIQWSKLFVKLEEPTHIRYVDIVQMLILIGHMCLSGGWFRAYLTMDIKKHVLKRVWSSASSLLNILSLIELFVKSLKERQNRGIDPSFLESLYQELVNLLCIGANLKV